MDRKGQIGFGAIIMAAVAVLIGLAFYTGSISGNIGAMTKTLSATANTSVTFPTAGNSIELTNCGQKVITALIFNATGGGLAIPTTNYTLNQQASSDGYLAAYLTVTSSPHSGRLVNVTCTSFEPKGYISDGGSRGIVALIGIFCALLIMVAAMPNLREGIKDLVGI